MPLGHRGGSAAGYATKLAIALGEAPGPNGIRALLQSAYSYEAITEALKTLPIAGWIDDLSTPRSVERGVRHWAATRLAQARVFASGVRELVHLAHSLCLAARDLTLLLRMAYSGQEPPPVSQLAAYEDPLAHYVFNLYTDTRSYRGILDGLRRSPYYKLADLLERFVKLEGENGIDVAIDAYIAWFYAQAFRRARDAYFQLCPRMDLLYARTMLNFALRGAPREVLEEFTRLLRPCRLPDLSREASVGDPEALVLKLRSTPYGEVTERDMLDAFSRVETLILKTARSQAIMGIASNPSSLQYAAAALNYILLDVIDIGTIVNGVYAGAKPQEIAESLSIRA